MNRLRERYKNEIAQEIVKKLNLTNIMEATKLQKIVVNAGIGEFRENREAVDAFVEDLAGIAGQFPTPKRARMSIAGFKVREGDVVGYTVTLRGEKMWSFLDKFVSVVLPRVRDFKGMNLNSFDQSGNFAVGIREHVIFPEVNPNKVKGNRSMQVNFTIKSKGKEHSLAFLEAIGMPFNKGQA